MESRIILMLFCYNKVKQKWPLVNNLAKYISSSILLQNISTYQEKIMRSSCLKYLSTPKLPTLLLEFLICKDKMPFLWAWVVHTKVVSRAISQKNTDMILNFGKPSKLLCSQSKVLDLVQVSMKTYIMSKETMLCTMMLRVLQQRKLSLFLMTQ